MIVFLKVAGAFLVAMLPGTFLILGIMYLHNRRKKNISADATKPIRRKVD